MKLDEIKIPKLFKISNPTEAKMKAKRRTFDPNTPIYIDTENNLIDGYIQYLLLKEKNLEANVNIVKADLNQYGFVYGKHYPDQKEYCWKISNKKKGKIGSISIGDHLW